jgi:hypothetical protein
MNKILRVVSALCFTMLAMAAPAYATEITNSGGWAYEEVGTGKYQLVMVKAQGGATATAPTYNEGDPAGMSFDLKGQLRIALPCIAGESYCYALSPNSYLMVQPVGKALNGATTKRYISVGVTEDKHQICSAPCTLYSVTSTNTNAAARYLKCENDVTANTAPGTDVPELDLAIPGATTGAGITFQFPVGAAFSVGLTCWLVTGTAEADVAEVAANEIKIFYTFAQ